MTTYWIRPEPERGADLEKWKKIVDKVADCANGSTPRWDDGGCGEFHAQNERLAELLLEEHVTKNGGKWGRDGC